MALCVCGLDNNTIHDNHTILDNQAPKEEGGIVSLLQGNQKFLCDFDIR
jgi:hypothetical protein